MSTRKLPRLQRPSVELFGGRYFRLFELGQGGMATVDLAVQHGPLGPRKLFALKRPRLDLVDEPEVRAMFEEEARISAALNHPNLVQVYEYIEDDITPALVMEYVDGLSYQTLRGHGAITAHLFVLMEVLRGLESLHQVKDLHGGHLGVVHRDISPQNVMISRDGHVKVLDFGIAKSKRSLVRTEAGVVKGKQVYMSPEQARGEPVDARTDVYAVGVMLWQVLTRGNGADNQNPARPSSAPLAESRPGSDEGELQSRLEGICQRALAPNAAERFASATEFRQALEALGALARQPAAARAWAELIATQFRSEGEAQQQRIRTALAQLPRGLRSELAFATTEPVLPLAHGARREAGSAAADPPRRRATSRWALPAVAVTATVLVGLVLAWGWLRRLEPASVTPEHAPPLAIEAPAHHDNRGGDAKGDRGGDAKGDRGGDAKGDREGDAKGDREAAAGSHVPSLSTSRTRSALSSPSPPDPVPDVDARSSPARRSQPAKLPRAEPLPAANQRKVRQPLPHQLRSRE